MSQEGIKTVREVAAAFNRGDLDAWLEYLADDIDYRRLRVHSMTTVRSTAGTLCTPTLRTRAKHCATRSTI